MAQQKKKNHHNEKEKRRVRPAPRLPASARRRRIKKRPIRREVAGAILLVLALCRALAISSRARGCSISRRSCAGRSLAGAITSSRPHCCWGSYILLFHRGRNVASCLVGTALLPVVFGAIMHIALCKEKYVNMDGILKLLWTSGNALESGGAVSASLAIMLVLLVKKGAGDGPARCAVRRVFDDGVPFDACRRDRGRALARARAL